MRPSFAFLPVASALHDEVALARVLARLEHGLSSRGGRRVDDVASAGDDPLVVVALTGGTEQRVLEAWRTRRAQVPWEPLVVVAHPGQNSLPAALEALARVQQDGGRGRIVYVDGPADERAWEELGEVARDLGVRRALAGLRIGLVGQPSDWLVASMPSAATVSARWGPEVVELDIGDALGRFERAAPASSVVAAVAGGATTSVEPTPDALAYASRFHTTLVDIAREKRVDAVAVRCFDLVTEAHTSGCVALAELNDAGVTAGCEGDIVSTIAMAWLRLLVGETPWMANPARVDVSGNRLLLAHCTIARSLLSSYRLRSHFESGLGVAIEGDIAATEVTLARIGGRDLDRIWIAEGSVERTSHENDLCRTQLHVVLDDGHVRELLEAPLGNHVVVVPGRHARRLRGWWTLLVAG